MKYIFFFFLLFIYVSCAKPVELAQGTEGGNCYKNNTCDSGLMCFEKICVENMCFNVNCVNGFECNTETGKCDVLKDGFCVIDDDCKSPQRPICKNRICIADNPPECTSNNDCTNLERPICDNGVCIADDSPECTSNSDCTDLEKLICDKGVCIAEIADCIGLSFDNAVVDPEFIHVYHGYSGDYELSLEFYTQTHVGNYDLSIGENDNYAYCKQCVSVFIGSTNGEDEKVYFQEFGNMEITTGNAEEGSSAGNITNIKLIEVTIDFDTFKSTPVEGGGCIKIEMGSDSWSWNALCSDGDTRCNFDRIETCNLNHIWVETENCLASDKICNDSSGLPICN